MIYITSGFHGNFLWCWLRNFRMCVWSLPSALPVIGSSSLGGKNKKQSRNKESVTARERDNDDRKWQMSGVLKSSIHPSITEVTWLLSIIDVWDKKASLVGKNRSHFLFMEAFSWCVHCITRGWEYHTCDEREGRANTRLFPQNATFKTLWNLFLTIHP